MILESLSGKSGHYFPIPAVSSKYVLAGSIVVCQEQDLLIRR
jgi:hypothetical protein